MENKDELKKLMLFILIIVAILAIFYGITILATNKLANKEEQVEEKDYSTVIDYDTILVSDIYNQSETGYYVLAVMPNDDNANTYNSNLTEYQKQDNALKVYNVDLSSAFNKKYIAEESNFVGKYPVFKETTLLKIENKTIIEAYQGKDEITTILNILTQE